MNPRFSLLLALCVAACGGGAPLPAPGPELVPLGQYDLEVPEPSGLAYRAETQTLFTVADQPDGNLYEIDLEGNLLRKVVIRSVDPEGVTLGLNDEVLVVEESRRRVVSYQLTGERLDIFGVRVGGRDNKGLEGIGVDPESGWLYLVNQDTPRLLVILDAEGREQSRHAIRYAVELTGICYDPSGPYLWVVSGADNMLYRMARDGFIDARWPLPFDDAQGIALGADNRLYIVSDKAERLFVFEKP